MLLLPVIITYIRNPIVSRGLNAGCSVVLAPRRTSPFLTPLDRTQTTTTIVMTKSTPAPMMSSIGRSLESFALPVVVLLRPAADVHVNPVVTYVCHVSTFEADHMFLEL